MYDPDEKTTVDEWDDDVDTKVEPYVTLKDEVFGKNSTSEVEVEE